jgi:hypothetical protein
MTNDDACAAADFYAANPSAALLDFQKRFAAAPSQSAEPVVCETLEELYYIARENSKRQFMEIAGATLKAAPQPSPTAVVLDDDRAGLQSILDAGRNAKPLHEGGVGENTVYLAPEMYASLARTLAQPVEQTRALTELKNIAEAKRFNRDHFDDDTAFADWVQSRARHFLAAQPAQTEQPSPRCPEGGKCTGNCDHCRT